MTDEQLGRAFRQLWEDQRTFNTLFRRPPTTEEEVTAQAREFVLYTEDELHELLRCFRWKGHRRSYMTKYNPAQINNELADILKCVVSLFQICGWNPEDLVEHYREKTAVVRQRYQEEWAQRVDRPCVIVDIDQVLCDYVRGVTTWLCAQPDLSPEVHERARHIAQGAAWIDGKILGIPEAQWQILKHNLRSTRAKQAFPVFADAQSFLQACRSNGFQIILLTSRPIERYPNLYTDTLVWLQRHDLPFDFLWWSFDKPERILQQDIQQHVKLVVDDDERHLKGFASLGIPCCWVRRDAYPTASHPTYNLVRSLDEIMFVTPA